MPSRDIIVELTEQIESQNWNYVVGIIKPKKDNPNSDDLEIYTNSGSDGLDKLLKILTNIKKSRKIEKEKEESKKDESK